MTALVERPGMAVPSRLGRFAALVAVADPAVRESVTRTLRMLGAINVEHATSVAQARALYTDPKVLVLDEATSALDASTEAAVTATVAALRAEVTVLVVAHRLATVRDCDAVVLLEDGRVVDVGTFDEVVARVPDFAVQAQLSGLAGA